MKLVIAEKPSVAQSLAAVLGAKERGQGYLQGNGYVVSWCVGHLIGLAAADIYDARYSNGAMKICPLSRKNGNTRWHRIKKTSMRCWFP